MIAYTNDAMAGHRQQRKNTVRRRLPPSRRRKQRSASPKISSREADVELALHRHRPDVLQRRHRLAGPQVVRRGRGQFPVLLVAEAGQVWSAKVSTGLRLDRDGEHRGGGQHHDQRRKQPPGQPLDRGPGPATFPASARSAAPTRRRKAGQGQEHVHTAGHPAEPDVEQRDQGRSPPLRKPSRSCRYSASRLTGAGAGAVIPGAVVTAGSG